MQEKDIRLEIQVLMRSLGFWDYHPPDDTPVVTPTQIEKIIDTFHLPKNAWGILLNIFKLPEFRRETISMARPDIFCLNPFGRTAVIEVKIIEPKVKIEPWLNPRKISNGQRDWLDRWSYDADGLGFLAVGTIETPRRLWIVPWKEWDTMEKRIAERQPIVTEIPDFRINISDLLADYELKKITGGWALPLFHPLLGEAMVNELHWKKNPISFRFEEDKK